MELLREVEEMVLNEFSPYSRCFWKEEDESEELKVRGLQFAKFEFKIVINSLTRNF